MLTLNKIIKMLKLLSFFLLFISININGQSLDDTLFVSKTADLDWCSKYRSHQEFKFIKFEDGSLLKKGDTLKTGSPSSINYTKSTIVQEKDDESKIKSVTTNNFTYLVLKDFNYSANPSGYKVLPESYKNNLFVIEYIRLRKGLLRRSYGTPYLELKLLKKNTFEKIETRGLVDAIESRELINPNILTKEEAIAKLKEGKELLELGVLTQQEYDQLKLKLTPFIIK
jgi:hypothetical protein